MARLGQFDILKAIGIILVIIGHTIKDSLVCNFIYSFHMPLFFLVSGYFLRPRASLLPEREPTKRLLLPYLTTGAVLVVLLSLSAVLRHDFSWGLPLHYLAGVGYGNSVADMSFQSVGPLWFLLALFWGIQIVQVALYFQKRCPAAISVGFCLIVSLLLAKNNILLPWSIRQGMMAAAYIYAGYAVKQYWPTVSLPSKIAWLPLLAVWAVSIKTGFLSLLQGYAQPELITLLGALCGTYFVYELSVFVLRSQPVSAALESVGRLTLLIMCVHALEDLTVPWQQIAAQLPMPALAGQVLIAATRIVLVLGVSYALRPLPFVQRLFNIRTV